MAEQTPTKRSYKDTINKPQTAFPMKANLVQNEPASFKRWQEMGLYEKIRHASHPAGKYVFHDGPPYANGSIHLGHLLNKVLKDIVVRSKTMAGFDCPYVPGWDCHGLPIEHKVVQELGEKAREMEPYQIRRKCQAYAEKFVKLQSGQMQRLLTLADYEHPYLTMAPEYEGAVLEVFADLVAQGLVYRALKPVHWSIANRTALAEAELEYEDREDTSVYVLFEVTNPDVLAAACGLAGFDVPVYLMIWTTTPWTLPANLAVAVSPSAEYGIYGTSGQNIVVAADLVEKVLRTAPMQPIATIKGKTLTPVAYKHPFMTDGRTRRVVTADYVTLEDGTGLVHTAPGHGVEDYQTGLREKLPIYCPVKEDGTFDDTVPEWLRAPGVDVWKANELVVNKLRESGHLFHAHQFTHSYPHDWRSKTPVIFRATEQWFVGVDKPLSLWERVAASSPPGEGMSGGAGATVSQGFRGAPHPSPLPKGEGAGTLRHMAIAAADNITFIPDWGRNRLRGMLESRPDWCISRQRSWGLPIPAFFPPEGVQGEPLLTAASVRAVAANIRKHGSDYWFKATAAELLAGYEAVNDPAAPQWTKKNALSRERLKKATDIFDVWFDSGTSWAAVIEQRRLGHDWATGPLTDLYLEGSDQHRGWFQASLLPALGARGKPPYRTVLTHGFMVDKDGRKMSKSLGNALEVETLLKDHGADVCRWWVSSINTDNDIKVDPEFFKLAGEEYRKVRNTIKYLLSNLYDFRVAGAAQRPDDAYRFTDADATSLDAWAVGELNKLIASVKRDYEAFHFRGVHEAVFNFCNETMSAVYLAATKDRLYCDKPDSPRRRRSQTAMHLIADALIRLIAPILPHTADEAWRHLHPRDDATVHLEVFPEAVDAKVDADWPRLMALRDRTFQFLEQARQLHGIENPLDVWLNIKIDPDHAFVEKFKHELPDIYGVSNTTLTGVDEKLGYAVATEDVRHKRDRCERCWKRDGTVKQRSDGGMLSERDAAALGLV